MSQNFISTNQELHKGDFLVSNNGNSKVVFEEDGNLVVYKWTKVWESGTAGKDPYRLLLQSDTNLVMYTAEFPHAVWASGTCIRPPNFERMRMTITDDAELTVESNGTPIWSNGVRLCQE